MADNAYADGLIADKAIADLKAKAEPKVTKIGPGPQRAQAALDDLRAWLDRYRVVAASVGALSAVEEVCSALEAVAKEAA